MVTVKYDKCDLCAQPVEIDGFSIGEGQAKLSFCCAGCQSIYRLIYMNNPTKEPNIKTKDNEDKK